MSPAELATAARVAHERLMAAYATIARHAEVGASLDRELDAAILASNRAALALIESNSGGESEYAATLRRHIAASEAA